MIYLEIISTNIEYNIRHIESCGIKRDCIIAVLKSNAYGHNIQKIGEILINYGIDKFAVYTYQEAQIIRKINKNVNILILQPVPYDFYLDCAKDNIDICLDSFKGLLNLIKFKKEYTNIGVHLKLDVGLNRYGFNTKIESVDKIIYYLKKYDINPKCLYSHLTFPNEIENQISQKQILKFNYILKYFNVNGIYFEQIHLFSSGILGCIKYKDFNNQNFRIGAALYGMKNGDIKECEKLKPVLQAYTYVDKIKKIKKGEYLGYGKSYIANDNKTIALLPVGFSNGLIPQYAQKGYVKLNDYRCKIISIFMNTTIIDITGCNVAVGNEAYFISANDKFFSPSSVAERMNVSSSLITTLLGNNIGNVN